MKKSFALSRFSSTLPFWFSRMAANCRMAVDGKISEKEYYEGFYEDHLTESDKDVLFND